jgi:hypothetical protein
MYYSAKTRGFYSLEIHGDKIPSDSVEITEAQHVELLAGQSSGRAIVPDKNGAPILESIKVPDDAHYARRARKERDSLLLDCDWTVLTDVPMNDKAREKWIEYRQSLRDVPLQPTFPQKIDWPTPPKSGKKEK